MEHAGNNLARYVEPMGTCVLTGALKLTNGIRSGEGTKIDDAKKTKNAAAKKFSRRDDYIQEAEELHKTVLHKRYEPRIRCFTLADHTCDPRDIYFMIHLMISEPLETYCWDLSSEKVSLRQQFDMRSVHSVYTNV
ncbi:unnamed protein product [Toxocara canis]|uniref:Pkinase_fungal domain-containing protein n=1 Tax=Toxocara canis TaxID=6265 RepID=A0A183VFD0_TOXCA|nr:unnamed protein product [Toxocara canis]